MGNDISSPLRSFESPKQKSNHEHINSAIYRCGSCNKIMYLCCNIFYHRCS